MILVKLLTLLLKALTQLLAQTLQNVMENHPDIVHAIRAHHDDEKPSSVLAHIVSAADALSGARPGARKAMMESYVSRLTDIEEIVNSLKGIKVIRNLWKCREVRVFVENDRVTDEETVMLSRDIAKKIESEMSYPGTIKVTVVRETKAIGVHEVIFTFCNRNKDVKNLLLLQGVSKDWGFPL